jgi:hypothetical protein
VDFAPATSVIHLGTITTQQSFASSPYPGAIKQGATAAMTGTTSTAVLAAVASNYMYATSCVITNSHATVGTLVSLQDGSGGTTLSECYAAAAGGGCSLTFPTPLKTSNGNGLYAVNGTTGSNTYASCTGYASTVSY